MLTENDRNLINELLDRISDMPPGRLISVYDMLVARERFMKGDVVFKLGPRNVEQLLVFIKLWEKSKIAKYEEFLTELLTRMKYKRSRWYAELMNKSRVVESDIIKSFMCDLKEDLEVYIIHRRQYDKSKLFNEYIEKQEVNYGIRN